MADFTTLGAQQGNLLADSNGLFSRSNLQLRIQPHGLSGCDDDILADVFLETGERDRQLIGSRGHLGQCVVSSLRCGGSVSRAGL